MLKWRWLELTTKNWKARAKRGQGHIMYGRGGRGGEGEGGGGGGVKLEAHKARGPRTCSCKRSSTHITKNV